ncbi:hypothetical protein JCM6882_005410 [Rhodosporidiobolus microsporus]
MPRTTAFIPDPLASSSPHSLMDSSATHSTLSHSTPSPAPAPATAAAATASPSSPILLTVHVGAASHAERFELTRRQVEADGGAGGGAGGGKGGGGSLFARFVRDAEVEAKEREKAGIGGAQGGKAEGPGEGHGEGEGQREVEGGEEKTAASSDKTTRPLRPLLELHLPDRDPSLFRFIVAHLSGYFLLPLPSPSPSSPSSPAFSSPSSPWPPSPATSHPATLLRNLLLDARFFALPTLESRLARALNFPLEVADLESGLVRLEVKASGEGGGGGGGVAGREGWRPVVVQGSGGEEALVRLKNVPLGLSADPSTSDLTFHLYGTRLASYLPSFPAPSSSASSSSSSSSSRSSHSSAPPAPSTTPTPSTPTPTPTPSAAPPATTAPLQCLIPADLLPSAGVHLSDYGVAPAWEVFDCLLGINTTGGSGGNGGGGGGATTFSSYTTASGGAGSFSIPFHDPAPLPQRGVHHNPSPSLSPLAQRLSAACPPGFSPSSSSPMYTFIAEEFVLRVKARAVPPAVAGGGGGGSAGGRSVKSAAGAGGGGPGEGEGAKKREESQTEMGTEWELVFVSCRLQTPERFVYEFSKGAA